MGAFIRFRDFIKKKVVNMFGIPIEKPNKKGFMENFSYDIIINSRLNMNAKKYVNVKKTPLVLFDANRKSFGKKSAIPAAVNSKSR